MCMYEVKESMHCGNIMNSHRNKSELTSMKSINNLSQTQTILTEVLGEISW